MLRLDHLTLRFEGMVATDDVCMEVEDHKVTALIGPNGAGKTTLFNQITGVLVPESGHIYLDDEDITGLKPYQICLKGITRTYQVIKLFSGMTCLENVLVGMHTKLEQNFWQDMFHTKKMRQQEKQGLEKAHKLLELVGLDQFASYPAGALSYGQQRLVEIARALASDPKIILLDEPAAGMNTKEKMDLNDKIRKIIDMGTTVLLVEHDMSLVMNIADKIYVINSGKNLAEGTPEEVSNNPDVIEAYLGSGEY
ncbi:MAG: ABC transporter ATP-binding protein [Firmicutes bacterium]|nr:ABC transporter ATP-binding protein [Bacillota bacterium]